MATSLACNLPALRARGTSKACTGARPRVLPHRASASARRASHVARGYEGVMDAPEQGAFSPLASTLLNRTPNEINITEVMSSPAISLHYKDHIMVAMRELVDKNISGVPVLGDAGEVVGVVSGYDLLALACTPGKLDDSDGYFPKVDKCIREYGGDSVAMWKAFKDLRNDLQKENAKTVGAVMHEAYTVPSRVSLAAAADVIVQRKLHRLCVVDDEDRLIGVVSRGDLMRATMQNFQSFMKDEDERASSSSDDED